MAAVEEPAEAERARRRFEALNRGGLRAASGQLDRGDFLSAIRSLSEIIAAHPELDEVRLKLAVALFASGDYRAAADEYEKLARSDPADAGLPAELWNCTAGGRAAGFGAAAVGRGGPSG